MSISTQLVKKLVQIPIFGGLTIAEAAEFFEAAQESSIARGTTLFREGDDGDALLVILEGEVAITLKAVELAKLSKHHVLGEMSLMGEGEVRSATATALTDVKVLTVPCKRVQKMLKNDHVAALKVVANLAQVMSKRLAALSERFVNVSGGGKKKEELADFGRILTTWQF
ncbi:MAG: cyclic nucleotide-binding domain-containing protein [Archangium sp.]|nr:cyclic nucleotide-binding domain-containing protein [Archangium sp.]MDP3154106.1 cyclic nucleotide-binding domain-containing protein [Archangium sp.]MDP3569990.1 cyclic nucleotide-binding domain-containing protein [Archangium sp.]